MALGKEGGLGVSRVAGLANFSFLSSKFTFDSCRFQVLRCVAGSGFRHFCARASVISLKIPILSGFRSYTVHVVN